MPVSQPTDAQLLEAVRIRANYPTIADAARAMDLPRKTLAGWLEYAEARGLAKPRVSGDQQKIIDGLRTELDLTRAALANAVRPRFTIRQDGIKEHDDLLILVMGDAHDSPKIPDKRRFEIAGKFCADRKHDILLSMGDFLDMLSLCFHVPDENYSGRAKPTFLEDIASGREAFAALNSGLGNWKPEKHKVQGNHENRLYRMEDKSPSAMGMYVALYEEMMTGAGMTYSPYGETTFYGGVGFTHIPIGIMGKPLGGKQVLTALGRDSIYDTCTAHTHVPGELITRKIGQRHVRSIDAGCFLPHGRVEDYAEHTLGGWGWGLTELRIANGQIQSRKWYDLPELEEQYG